MPDLTRITVNLIPRASVALEAMSGQTGMSKTDLINRGIQLLELWEHLSDSGVVTIRTADGELHRIHLL